MLVADFQQATHAILISFAFLSKAEIENVGWFLTYEDQYLNIPLGVSLHQMGGIPTTQFPVFTTNRYLGHNAEALPISADGTIDANAIDALYPNMPFFPKEVFEKLCQNALAHEKVMRSLVLLANNAHTTLELKMPIQYVVLEALSAVLTTGGNADLKPLNDAHGEMLIAQLRAVVEKFVVDHDLETNPLIPVFRKLENLNSPPNADKLSKVFGQLGYTLTEEESLVISNRNTFLHGGLPKLPKDSEDYRELLHRSLRLHFLVAVLLLKPTGFTGRIINYAQLYRVATGKSLKELVLPTI